jgi:PIN domain nuclease of toxin-antitoxin system
MNGYLLDTHILIWWIENNPALSDVVRQVISDPRNDIYVSAVSIWEICIKQGTGKLSLPGDLPERIRTNNFLPLSIRFDHALAVQGLPFHHTDPFDRMLIAQSEVEGLTLITHDSRIWVYPISLLKV